MTHSTSPESVTVKVTESSGMVLVMVCPPLSGALQYSEVLNLHSSIAQVREPQLQVQLVDCKTIPFTYDAKLYPGSKSPWWQWPNLLKVPSSDHNHVLSAHNTQVQVLSWNVDSAWWTTTSG